MARIARLKPIIKRKEYLVTFHKCPYCKKQYATESEAKRCRRSCARKRWRRDDKKK